MGGRLRKVKGEIWVQMKKKKENPKKNEVHICSSCGREIIGDFEYIKTKRGTDDYFEKAKFVNTDSQLYKQAGNGVTVNVVRAIGDKMTIRRND